jgi:hypothetical protein
LASTTRILEQTGAGRGSCYGRLSDAALYSAILNLDVDLFSSLVREIAGYLIDQRVACVAGDALEGYNPAHDACRLVIGCAVEMTRRSGKGQVRNYDFALAGPSGGRPDTLPGEAIRLTLDEAALARKLAAARAYDELASEVDSAVRENSTEAFRVECLRPARNSEKGERFASEKPYYEQYGERQVAAGYYREVIRYQEHFRPLADRLWSEVATT